MNTSRTKKKLSTENVYTCSLEQINNTASCHQTIMKTFHGENYNQLLYSMSSHILSSNKQNNYFIVYYYYLCFGI